MGEKIHNCSDCKDYEPRICDLTGGKPSTRYGPLRKKVGVTRAFGDFDLQEHGVILGSTPSTEALTLQAGDLLILASDGLWDALHLDQVMREINQAPKNHIFTTNECQLNPARLSSELATLAKTSFWDTQGYQDDISVLAWCVPGHADESSAKSFLSDPQIASDWLKGGGIGDRCQVINERVGLKRTQQSTCGHVNVNDLRSYDPKGIRLKCYNLDGSRPETNGFGTCALPRYRPCLRNKFVNGGCHQGLECREVLGGFQCTDYLDPALLPGSYSADYATAATDLDELIAFGL
jgi:hypothetical protein